MPPIVVLVLGAVGAIAAAKWIVREARRINAELHPEPEVLDIAEPDLGNLRRDPTTGVYHPEKHSL
jgi:hypothetical protein